MSLLAKRYATALHMAAREQSAVDAVGRDLAVLHDVALAPAVRALLTSPDIRSDERAAMLAKVGKGMHVLVQNLLGLLQQRRRLDVLFDIHPEYRRLLLADRGELEGVAETPRPLADGELARLGELAARLSGRKVVLSVQIVPELIGGIRLRVGNVLYDGSVRNALDQLEQRLLQTSI
jgi:F-type H+-transporting ATPase subunit delta